MLDKIMTCCPIHGSVLFSFRFFVLLMLLLLLTYVFGFSFIIAARMGFAGDMGLFYVQW